MTNAEATVEELVGMIERGELRLQRFSAATSGARPASATYY